MANSKFQDAGFKIGDAFAIQAKAEFVNVNSAQLDQGSYPPPSGYIQNLSLYGRPEDFKVFVPEKFSDEDKARITQAAMTYLGMKGVCYQSKSHPEGTLTFKVSRALKLKDGLSRVQDDSKPQESLKMDIGRPKQYLRSESGTSLKVYDGPGPAKGETVIFGFEIKEFTAGRNKGVTGYLQHVIYEHDMKPFAANTNSIYGYSFAADGIEGLEKEPSVQSQTSGDDIPFGHAEVSPAESAANAAFAPSTENPFAGLGDASAQDNPFASPFG